MAQKWHDLLFAHWAVPEQALRRQVPGKVELDTFEGQDVCCSIIATLEDAVRDPHFAARKVFERRLVVDGRSIPALPSPIVPSFQDAADGSPPPLGSHSEDFF